MVFSYSSRIFFNILHGTQRIFKQISLFAISSTRWSNFLYSNRFNSRSIPSQRRLLSLRRRARALIVRNYSLFLTKKQALRLFCVDERINIEASKTSDTTKAVDTTLWDPSLFSLLDELIGATTLIHQAQIEAEGDNAYIGSVRNRWNSIVKHLKTCKRTITTDLSALISTLEHQYNRPVNDLHYLAH